MSTDSLTHLDELEAEAIFILREVFAKFKNPIIMFSGGKDSITLTHLAKKAFHPGKIPFSLLHVDTGHNFPEAIQFRDELTQKLGVKLIVAKGQDSIDSGRVEEETGVGATRNFLQIRTLLDAIDTHEIDRSLVSFII